MRKALYSNTLENLVIIAFVRGCTASSFWSPHIVGVARPATWLDPRTGTVPKTNDRTTFRAVREHRWDADATVELEIIVSESELPASSVASSSL